MVGRYHAFWNLVRLQLRAPHAYTFVTGKQMAFALLGLGVFGITGGFVSPTKHMHLVLGALTAPDIKLTYENTQVCETAEFLSTYFKPTSPELLDYFCNKVCEVTAGLPRMVHACFEALCQLEQNCLVMSSEEHIDKALEDAYWYLTHHDTRNTSLRCSPEAMAGPLSGAYCALLLVSLLDLSLDSCNGYVALGTGGSLPLLEVVNSLDLFIDTRGCQGYQVRIRSAKWILRHLLARPDVLDGRFRLLVPLWNIPASVLGKGEPLELIIRTRLTFVLSLGVAAGGRCCWAELFPVFCNTLLAPCIVNIDLKCPVWCIPKVLRESPQDLRFDSTSPWSHHMGMADWAALFKSGLFPPNSIGFPAPESHSPDVLVRCGNDMVAAIQCKLGTTAVTWATLQAEIDKTSHLLHACRKVCLVMVAFALGQQLLSAFHDGDATKLVVGAGKWLLCNTKLQLSCPMGMRNHGDAVLEVPERMEVVVLGSSGLRSFLGDESVCALEKLIKARGDAPVTKVVCPLQLSLSLLSTCGMHHILSRH